MRLISAKYLFEQGVKNIWKNKLMAFASFCVLLVSLLLVGFSLLFYMNVSNIVKGIEGKNEAMVFLEDDITDQGIIDVQNLLEQNQNISRVVFYSKEQAYADFKDNMSEYEMIFDSLDENVLPDSFKIQIKDIENIDATITEISGMTDVYHVKAPFDFADILIGLNQIISIVATSIIAALILVSMVIISNATKASVFARRKEISIMKYVGATNFFIRIPFFVEGMVTGIVSGLAATGITWLAYDALLNVLMTKVKLLDIISSNSLLPFSEFAPMMLLAYVLIGAGLGAIGTVISTRKHLKV